MMLTARLLELVAPLIAFSVVMAAALVAQPPLIALLAVVWFLPWVPGWLAPRTGVLDEREVTIQRRAERTALRLLLLFVCAIPLLPGASATGALRLIRSEWVDAALLLTAVFFVRALSFAGSALGARAAMHYAGGLAAMISLGWTVGSIALRPSFGAPVLLFAMPAVAPHLIALRWRPIAGTLWGTGAGLVAVYSIGSGMVPIEVVVALALLALPWAAAGWWSLRPDLV